MSLDLTETQKSIRGMFWLPGCEDFPLNGVLRLKAGRSASLDIISFNQEEIGTWISNRPKPQGGEELKLTAKAFFDAMHMPSKRVIHGHDENGKPITLLKCYASSSNSTLAMASHRFSCQAAIFGVHLHNEDLNCHGIRLHLDHLDSWVGRSAFRHYKESEETEDGTNKLTKITIPIANNLSIPLSLPGYSKSEFFCSWRMRPSESEFRLTSKVYLDLHFEQPREWEDVLHEVHRWQWLMSLATRNPVDVMQFALYRSDVTHPIGRNPMTPCDVWMKRKHSRKAPESKHAGYDFHFTFSDVEKNFSALIGKWNQIQQPWAAVLHRFFATSHRRGLWLNEEFLFLAQAVESIHRARTGDTDGKGVVDRAAKQAYLNSPSELQQLLGDRGKFISLFRKTRNYWTHYGEPSPESDPEVLGDIALHDFNQKLRWIVESAILSELGVPDQCVSKVWSSRWKAHLVTFD